MEKKIYFRKMRTGLLSALFVFIMLSNTSSGQSTGLTLLSPNGGERYFWGSTVEITWENNGEPGDLTLEITDDGGFYWYSLGFIYADDTTNSAIVQLTGNITELAKIRIAYFNDPSISDESDGYFTITEAPVYFSTPSYGSSYYQSQPVYISWYSSTLQTFTIDFSLDSGSTWAIITSDFTGFNYTWTAPDQVSSEALIRISDAADPTNYALSPVFSITESPVLQITAPNGGETWNYGEYATVSWTGSNLSAYVNIEISLDGGSAWSSLGYGYSNADGGSADVPVPYFATENALVRIMDYNYYFELDRSDAPFTVVVPPVIVYYPAGGEQYYNNQQMYFSWMASQEISSVNFELSTDNGQTWQLIDENIDAAMGYYYWTVSGTPSETCLIKISDASDASRFDLSGVFTILQTPVITLTSPVGGEIWNTGTSYPISWAYDNPGSSYVYLEYSTDNGQTWTFINYALLDGPEGSLEWTTPEIGSDRCRLRIMDYYLQFVVDTSDVFTIISFPETPICMVSVDSTTNHNIIVWNKPVSDLISKFVVYKESNEANIYEIIASVDYADEALAIDTNSNPNMKSYRYKLGFEDADGNLYPAGDLHQTIHLTINQGVGNSWNLIWTAYEGFEVSSYNLWRKVGNSGYDQIGTISASFNSYTDLGAPQGDVFYIVEVINPNGCNPASRSGDYSSSYSNVATNSVLGINDRNRDISVSVYPNPADKQLHVSAGQTLQGRIKIALNDLLGTTVYSQEVENIQLNSIHTIQTAELKEGIYVLKVSSDSGSFTRKIIIRH